jgi:hypothetical protein
MLLLGVVDIEILCHLEYLVQEIIVKTVLHTVIILGTTFFEIYRCASSYLFLYFKFLLSVQTLGSIMTFL